MPKKLLLADDSLTIEKIVRLTLADEDIEIFAANNGDSALTMVRSHRPDIILADVFMPGTNGYQVCAAVKDDPESAHIPVVLLVGAFEHFDPAEAERVRFNASLTKPFDTNELVRTVKALLPGAEAGAAVLGDRSPATGQETSGDKPHLVSARTKQSFLGSDSILELFGTTCGSAGEQPAPPMPEPVLVKSRPVQVIPFPGSKTQGEEPTPLEISEEVIEHIVQRVVRQLSQEVIREIAWEVVPQLSETMIRQVLEEQADSNPK